MVSPFPASEERRLGVFLKQAAEKPVYGRVIRVSPDQSQLKFPPGNSPLLALGVRVQLQFTARGARIPMVAARATGRVEEPDGRSYLFRHASASAFYHEIPAEIRTLLDRRRCPRVSPAEPLPLVLRADDLGATAPGELLDVSEGGATVGLAPQVDSTFFQTDRIALDLALPGLPPGELPGRVRQRHASQGRLTYGVEFDLAGEDQEPRRAALRAYVQARIDEQDANVLPPAEAD